MTRARRSASSAGRVGAVGPSTAWSARSTRGLALGEAEPETVEVGVPAVLFSPLIAAALAVVIAYFASIGLYSS